MGIKTKVMIGDETIEGEEIGFSADKEDWNIYKLDDGTKIKFKTVVIKIIRTNKRHPLKNDPIYSIETRHIADASVPEALKIKD